MGCSRGIASLGSYFGSKESHNLLVDLYSGPTKNDLVSCLLDLIMKQRKEA